ncbi:uncharacterized protein LOC134464476 isoform X2 [Engraulis encrasicolus]|uniref:uncharacterized protein LOC134464476 isoform X2 n=1 Tax=Engraulis encrasicolus TaxID=184585 RepID=UPI002FCFDE78
MARRGKKTRGKKAEETQTLSDTAASGETSATSQAEKGLDYLQTILSQLLEDNLTPEELETKKNLALNEMMNSGLVIMMQPRTSIKVQKRIPTLPKQRDEVKDCEKKLSEELLKKVFDMVEVKFLDLIAQGNVSKDYCLMIQMPQSSRRSEVKGGRVHKHQQQKYQIPKNLEEWTMDQYTLLLTRLTGHVVVLMLETLTDLCVKDASNQDKLAKVGLPKPVRAHTYNLGTLAARTFNQAKFKDFLKPGKRRKPFCLPDKENPMAMAMTPAPQAMTPAPQASAPASTPAPTTITTTTRAPRPATPVPVSTADAIRRQAQVAKFSELPPKVQALWVSHAREHAIDFGITPSAAAGPNAAGPGQRPNQKPAPPKYEPKIKSAVVNVVRSSIEELLKMGLLPTKSMLEER